MSSQAIALGADMLRRFPVNWASEGLDETALEGLAEVVMRLFLSFLQYPTVPPRSDDELRTFIHTWIVSTHCTSSASGKLGRTSQTCDVHGRHTLESRP